VNFGKPSFTVHESVTGELNRLQNDIVFTLPRKEYRNWAAPLDREAYTTNFVWGKLEEYRKQTKGFHPFIVAIVHGALRSAELSNLFGSHDAERGFAVVTTKDWDEHFAPPSVSVFLSYYLVRYTLSFICPAVKTHEATRGCFFDKKLNKSDIKVSMAAGKICDECAGLFSEQVDAFSYEALAKLVSFVKTSASSQNPVRKPPSVFVGSSSEGLRIAEYLQLGLERVAECTIWSQGVFDLTAGTLEDLVRASRRFEYAVLVLTPDDVTVKRGTATQVARDNVLFELGLFMGALGRERTFIVHERAHAPALPTDLLGVTTCTYSERTDDNLEAALGVVCTRLKKAMGR